MIFNSLFLNTSQIEFFWCFNQFCINQFRFLTPNTYRLLQFWFDRGPQTPRGKKITLKRLEIIKIVRSTWSSPDRQSANFIHVHPWMTSNSVVQSVWVKVLLSSLCNWFADGPFSWRAPHPAVSTLIAPVAAVSRQTKIINWFVSTKASKYFKKFSPLTSTL
jgi:hypothetical protein